jgi:hypothetical protein
VYYVPQLDFGFIALTNASYAHLSTSFATALTTLCIMPAPVTPPNFSMTPADYARYGGQFHDAYNVGDVLVKTSANQLTVEIPVFDQIGLAYNHTLLPATPNNFILYLYGLTLFDALPLPVTFILDDKGSRVYFRTRSFVARYIGEIPPKSGRRRKSAWPESAPSRLLSDWNRYLPEPQLPFITPPPR